MIDSCLFVRLIAWGTKKVKKNENNKGGTTKKKKEKKMKNLTGFYVSERKNNTSSGKYKFYEL